MNGRNALVNLIRSRNSLHNTETTWTIHYGIRANGECYVLCDLRRHGDCGGCRLVGIGDNTLHGGYGILNSGTISTTRIEKEAYVGARISHFFLTTERYARPDGVFALCAFNRYEGTKKIKKTAPSLVECTVMQRQVLEVSYCKAFHCT